MYMYPQNKKNKIKICILGTSLAVQSLRLCATAAGGTSSITG